MPAPPPLIVRPAGVWDSRAPLHGFFGYGHEISRDLSLLTVALARVRYELSHKDGNDPKTSVRKFLKLSQTGPVGESGWSHYRRSWRSLTGHYEGQPSFDDVGKDMSVAVYAVRESAVARLSAAFETYVQCWALNMLLAYLEAGKELPSAARTLMHQFSPFRQRFMLPTVLTIFQAFPDVDSALTKLPHMHTDPLTGELVVDIVSPVLNAKSVVLFWRDFRNSVIHRSRLITHSFRDAHFETFEALRQPYAEKLRSLEPGLRLQLPDVVFGSMSATHTKCAVMLNGELQRVSSNRGRLKIGDKEPSRFDPSLDPGPLLTEGDHADSLRWIRDQRWRQELLAAHPRKWHNRQEPRPKPLT